MIVRVSNPVCIKMLRRSNTTNTELVERSMCGLLGIQPRQYKKRRAGRWKPGGGLIETAVNVRDERLVAYLRSQKASGISYQFSVEQALRHRAGE